MTVTTGTARPARAPRPRAIAPGVDPVDADIDLACRTLQLPTIREQHAEMAAAALREQASYTRFLADLLAAELAERLQRRKLRLVHEAGFARPKRLELSGVY
jgi:IstB-like ATP binding protein